MIQARTGTCAEELWDCDEPSNNTIFRNFSEFGGFSQCCVRSLSFSVEPTQLNDLMRFVPVTDQTTISDVIDFATNDSLVGCRVGDGVQPRTSVEENQMIETECLH